MSDKYLLHLLLAQLYLNTWVAVIDHCECTPFALARAKTDDGEQDSLICLRAAISDELIDVQTQGIGGGP